MCQRSSIGALPGYVLPAYRTCWPLLKLLQASLLISLRGIFNLTTYLIIMPAVSFVAAKYLNLHGSQRDYRLTQGSGMVATIGLFAMGLAPVPALLVIGMVFLCLGSAFPITVRSLVTSLVPPDHVGTLYSAIAITQSLGILVSGPLFAYFYRIGLHLGGTWMGMPFVQAGLLYMISTIAMWFVRVPETEQDEAQETEPLLSP